MHYVKARVWVHRYLDGGMAVFHGLRKLAEYTAGRTLITIEENKKSATGAPPTGYPKFVVLNNYNT